MGRGRAKAKQQKVARELKYGGPDTDLGRLAAELSKDRGSGHQATGFPEEEPDEDKYADWIDSEDDDDDAEETEDEEDDDRR